jgi:hypothetical protein
MWQNERLQQTKWLYKCCRMIINTLDIIIINKINLVIPLLRFVDWHVLSSVHNTRWVANHVIFSLKLNTSKSNVNMKSTWDWNIHCCHRIQAIDDRSLHHNANHRFIFRKIYIVKEYWEYNVLQLYIPHNYYFWGDIYSSFFFCKFFSSHFWEIRLILCL